MTISTSSLLGAIPIVAAYVGRSWLTSKAVMLADKLLRRFECRVVKTEREAIEWYHYRHRKAKQGHAAKHVVDCSEDGCARVTR